VTRRIAPQPVTLAIVPVELHAPPETREALLASNGVDLVARRVRRLASVLAPIVFMLVLARLLTGCASLGAASAGLQTARDVAKAGCALLAATDGSTASALAVTADVQRELFANAAEEAKRRGADARTIDALAQTAAALAEALREASKPVVEAGGDAPAKLPPCPAAAPTSSAALAP